MKIFKHLTKPYRVYRFWWHLTATLVVAALGFVGFLTFTPQGAKTCFELISDLSPYQIRYYKLSGTFAGQLTFEAFELTGPQIHCQASSINIQWQLSHLLAPVKTLRAFNAKDLNLNLSLDTEENTKEPESFQELQQAILNTLPVPLRIENVHIENARVTINNQSHDIETLMIKQASNQLFRIQEVHYQGSYGHIQAFLNKAIKINWDLSFEVPKSLQHQVLADTITSHGNIYLPNRKVEDLNNELNIAIKSNHIHVSKTQIDQPSLNINGTLREHQIELKGHYQGYPFTSTLKGQFTPQQWISKIVELQYDHPQSVPRDSKGIATFNWSTDVLLTELALDLFGQYPVKLNANIEKTAPFRLTGDCHLMVDDVKTLAKHVPQLNNVQGQLKGDFILSGTLKSPTIEGDLQLNQATIKTATLGTKTFINQLRIHLDESKNLSLTGTGSMGSGTFKVRGSGVLDPKNPSILLSLEGKTLLISDTPEYYIIADPVLTLALIDNQPHLSGQITLPIAEIKSLKNPESISASSDVVIVNSSSKKQAAIKTKPKNSPNLHTDIQLILGDAVTYTGHGLTTQVRGDVHLTQKPEQLMMAKGQLTLQEGKYRAYNKTFEIHHGQILFSGGPIYDPMLDVHAERKITYQSKQNLFKRQDEKPGESMASIIDNRKSTANAHAGLKTSDEIMIDVHLTGNLKSPKLEFNSSPPMSQADILSLLIVRRPQNEINEAQAELIFSAVSQLAHYIGKPGQEPMSNVFDQFKFEQFGLSKKPNHFPFDTNKNSGKSSSHNLLEDAAFVLGKQLSDRLYLHYSLGILDSASNFGLRYSFGKHVTLEAATNSQGSKSADVLITFESR